MLPLLRLHLDLAGHLGPDELAAAAIAVTWFNLMWYANSLQQASPPNLLINCNACLYPLGAKINSGAIDVSRL